MAFSPMRTVFSKKINQDLFVAKNKGIPSTILPTKIHGRRFQVAVPGVCNVLADVVQQNVHCEGLGLSWMDQNIVSEQCVFFQSAK